MPREYACIPIRSLCKKLDWFQWQQERDDQRRNNQVVAENQDLKAQVKELQEEISELQPRAEGNDTAVQQAKDAVQAKKLLELELETARRELLAATNRANGLRVFADFIVDRWNPSGDLAEQKRILALKLLLSGKNAAAETYELLGVAETLPLWKQLQSTSGNIKPDQFVQFYADLPPSAIEKRWFLRYKLLIEHNLDVDEKVSELHRQEREQQERQERLRVNQELEAGARACARLFDHERDPAGRPQFNPNVEYV
jgi:hypothetical protein